MGTPSILIALQISTNTINYVQDDLCISSGSYMLGLQILAVSQPKPLRSCKSLNSLQEIICIF